MFRNRQINLDPGFQRQSVLTWSDGDRLIQSILGGYPVPTVFLYRRTLNGRLVYDVIDGKQRLETIFMFTGVGRFKPDRFDARLHVGGGTDWDSWKDIRRCDPDQRAAFDSYRFQTVEVAGELAEIVDLVVRINSTGKRLTGGERRHARYYNSPFLKEAERLIRRHGSYL